MDLNSKIPFRLLLDTPLIYLHEMASMILATMATILKKDRIVSHSNYFNLAGRYFYVGTNVDKNGNKRDAVVREIVWEECSQCFNAEYDPHVIKRINELFISGQHNRNN